LLKLKGRKNSERLVKLHSLIITMPFSHRDVAITAREVQNPVYCITRPCAICEPPIVIHADIAPICTSLQWDTKFLAAVHPVMILDTALARTLQ